MLFGDLSGISHIKFYGSLTNADRKALGIALEANPNSLDYAFKKDDMTNFCSYLTGSMTTVERILTLMNDINPQAAVTLKELAIKDLKTKKLKPSAELESFGVAMQVEPTKSLEVPGVKSFFTSIAPSDVSRQPDYLYSVLNSNWGLIKKMPILDKIEFYLNSKFDFAAEIVKKFPFTEKLFYLAMELTGVQSEFPKIKDLSAIISDVYLELFQNVPLERLLGYTEEKMMVEKVKNRLDLLQTILPSIPSSEALPQTLLQDPNLVFRWGKKDVRNKKLLFEQLYDASFNSMTFFKTADALKSACYKIISDSTVQIPIMEKNTWQDRFIDSIDFGDGSKQTEYKESLKKFLVEQSISPDILTEITDDDLISYGFKELGPRRKITKALKSFNV